MKRREVILLLGQAMACNVSCLTAAWSQQIEKIRRVSVVLSRAADAPEAQIFVAAFMQGMQELGWSLGRNLRVDFHWVAIDEERLRRTAEEVAARSPDVILGMGSATVHALKRANPNIPIVFVAVADPLASGLVESLPRPGGTATGFLTIEHGLSTKWLELLKQIVPHLKRVAVVRDSSTAGAAAQLRAILGVAPSVGVEVVPVDAREASAIERSLGALAKESNVGVIVTTSRLARVHQALIIRLATDLKLPTIFPDRYYVIAGGLISYGTDSIDQFRKAATYVDRVLKGERPADLPVQAPTKYELVVNQKTANEIGITVPPLVLLRADEVIE